MSTPKQPPVVINTDIYRCARCNGDHDDLRFVRLHQPIAGTRRRPPLTHWSTCPATGEPILLRSVAR